jgi:hypothetical protein
VNTQAAMVKAKLAIATLSVSTIFNIGGCLLFRLLACWLFGWLLVVSCRRLFVMFVRCVDEKEMIRNKSVEWLPSRPFCL